MASITHIFNVRLPYQIRWRQLKISLRSFLWRNLRLWRFRRRNRGRRCVHCRSSRLVRRQRRISTGKNSRYHRLYRRRIHRSRRTITRRSGCRARVGIYHCCADSTGTVRRIRGAMSGRHWGKIVVRILNSGCQRRIWRRSYWVRPARCQGRIVIYRTYINSPIASAETAAGMICPQINRYQR